MKKETAHKMDQFGSDMTIYSQQSNINCLQIGVFFGSAL